MDGSQNIKQTFNQQQLNILTSMGLSDMAARVYLVAILATDPPSTDYLRKNLFLDQDSLVEHVNLLSNGGFVYSDVNVHGNGVIRVMDPRITARAALSESLWSKGIYLIEELDLLAQEDEGFRTLCLEFERIFWPLFQARSKAHDVTMVPANTISQHLAQLLSGAQNRIDGITVSPWTPKVAIVWETLKERMTTGITYRRICDIETFVGFGYRINRRDIHSEGVRLRVHYEKPLSKKFFLVDGKEALIFWPNSTGEGFRLEASITSLSVLVNSCIDYFEDAWSDSFPAEILLDDLGSYRRDYLRLVSMHCSPDHQDFAAGLFDYGIFFQPEEQGYSSDEKFSYIRDLKEQDLIIPIKGIADAFSPAIIDYVKSIIVRRVKERIP